MLFLLLALALPTSGMNPMEGWPKRINRVSIATVYANLMLISYSIPGQIDKKDDKLVGRVGGEIVVC